MEDFPVSLDTLIAFVHAIHPEGDALEALSDAIRVSRRTEDQADALIGHFVDQARRTGASWSQIGESMGVSKQAAQQRFVARPSHPIPGGQGRIVERFAPRARHALVVSRRLAADDAQATETEPRHIVGALLSEPESIAAAAIRTLGVSGESLFAALRLPPIIAVEPTATTEQAHSLQFGTDAKKMIAHALDVALHYVHNYIGTEHLLLSAAAEGPEKAALEALGLSIAQLRPVIENQLTARREAKEPGPR
ncbi:Clp protease N-terminal domain-containing protein [Arthrobacter dokdonensis]|uniref:Clp protease N-terminal domain-containing protein n=1 Tax=Arthrobacter dokdonellae TaxID=2211210 RepID=UPI000DE58E41|nr:Clp protease N-terminal domain-containing protein [Arthrobacter dokdonellae]